MTKIAKIDKATCEQLRGELMDILASYSEAMNLNFEIGWMRFTGTDIKMQISATVKGGKLERRRLL